MFMSNFIILFDCIRMDSQNMASLPRLAPSAQYSMMESYIMLCILISCKIDWYQSEWSSFQWFETSTKKKKKTMCVISLSLWMNIMDEFHSLSNSQNNIISTQRLSTMKYARHTCHNYNFKENTKSTMKHKIICCCPLFYNGSRNHTISNQFNFISFM